MNILKSLRSGAFRAMRSWKCVLIVWFSTLLIVTLFVLPVKSIMKAGLGSSTITELLRSGINIDVIFDLEKHLTGIISYLTSGLFLFLLIGIIVYSFFTGGLFKSVNNPTETLSVPCFFRASAKYFWYCLGLWLMIALIILISGLLIIGLPVGLISQSENGGGNLLVIAGIVCGSLFIIWLLILLLVADYSRAWLISAEKPAFFKAFGFGFSRTFSHKVSSFSLMLIIMIIMVLFGWLASSIIGIWKPETGGGVFLLFLVSQLLFFMKIMLKTWRYGSVTSMMEHNKP